MTPTQPLAWVLAALAIPVVLAYLHRRKRQTKKVPSALLFRSLAGPASPTRRSIATPRHLVSLLLILLALAGLVTALLDLRPEDNVPRDYIVVLDTSSSMSAVRPDTQTTRLDDAIEALDDAAGGLGPSDRLALITTGARTTVNIGLTEDHDLVTELARGQSTAGDSDAAAEAIHIADAMAEPGRRTTIVLISDGVGVGVPKTDNPLWHIPVGVAGPNFGINGIGVREADALGLGEVFFSVTSDAPKEHELEIAIRVDDTLVDVVAVTVPPLSQVDQLHRLELPPGERVSATLQKHGRDILAADDTASTARRAGGQVRVLLVAASRRSFTAEALRLHPRVELSIIGPYDRAEAKEYDLLVLEVAHQGALEIDVPRVLALGVPPRIVGLTADQAIASPEIIRWTFDDPLLRFVDFDGMELPRATIIEPRGDIRSLIDTEQGSIATRHRDGERDVVYLGWEPQSSDLVLRVGFVNLIANAVEWAAPVQDADGTTRGPSVLPASESRLEPRTDLADRASDEFTDDREPDRPLWQTLGLIVLALLVLEGLLPAGARLSRLVRIRRRR